MARRHKLALAEEFIQQGVMLHLLFLACVFWYLRVFALRLLFTAEKSGASCVIIQGLGVRQLYSFDRRLERSDCFMSYIYIT